MSPSYQLTLTFRTVCTRLPVRGAGPGIHRWIPETVMIRPGVPSRHPISVRYYRGLHTGRLLRNAEKPSVNKEISSEAESTMTSRAARLALEQQQQAAEAGTATTGNASSNAGVTASAAESGLKAKKKTLWQKVKDEAVHYWHGTKLLGLEIRISSKLIWKLLKGGKLTRREARQVGETDTCTKGNILV